MNGFSTTSFALNSDKCHFMTLETSNTLPNIKCKNIAIKNSACENVYVSLSITNLTEQRVVIINAYIKSLFNYCPLVWMFSYRGIMHKMNKIHEPSLSLLLKNYKDDFQDLLTSSGNITIHQRCINSVLTEVYNYIHGLSPGIMNEVFSIGANTYNRRQFNVFETHIPTSNRYVLNSMPKKANQRPYRHTTWIPRSVVSTSFQGGIHIVCCWNLLPKHLKSSPSLTLFKNKMKLWECFNCPCTYVRAMFRT